MKSLFKSKKYVGLCNVSIKSAFVFLSAFIIISHTACSSTEQKSSSGANSTDTQQAENSISDVGEAEKEATRVLLLELAGRTLDELKSLDPKLNDKIKNAYAYAVFDNFMVNLVFYVAGKGNGVAIKTSTNEPTYMLMLRAGTGPGIGYTKMRQLLVIQNQETFDLMTTVGLDIQVSAHAAFKIGKFGGSVLYAESVNPNVEVYTIVDSGIDLQANWGAVEYLKDKSLNEAAPSDAN